MTEYTLQLLDRLGQGIADIFRKRRYAKALDVISKSPSYIRSDGTVDIDEFNNLVSRLTGILAENADIPELSNAVSGFLSMYSMPLNLKAIEAQTKNVEANTGFTNVRTQLLQNELNMANQLFQDMVNARKKELQNLSLQLDLEKVNTQAMLDAYKPKILGSYYTNVLNAKNYEAIFQGGLYEYLTRNLPEYIKGLTKSETSPTVLVSLLNFKYNLVNDAFKNYESYFQKLADDYSERTKDGVRFSSVDFKNLYSVLEVYRKNFGKIPESIDELMEDLKNKKIEGVNEKALKATLEKLKGLGFNTREFYNNAFKLDKIVRSTLATHGKDIGLPAELFDTSMPNIRIYNEDALDAVLGGDSKVYMKFTEPPKASPIEKGINWLMWQIFGDDLKRQFKKNTKTTENKQNKATNVNSSETQNSNKSKTKK